MYDMQKQRFLFLNTSINYNAELPRRNKDTGIQTFTDCKSSSTANKNFLFS